MESLYRIVGKRGCLWLAAGFISSMSLASIEYSVVLVLQLLMKNLGFAVNIGGLDKYLFLNRFDLTSTMFLLVFVGAVRAMSIFLVSLSANAVRELITARLRMISVHQILTVKHSQQISSAEAVTRFSEIIPKTAGYAQTVVSCLAVAVQIFFISIGLIFITWKEALIGILGLFFIGFFVHSINRYTRKAARNLPKCHKDILTGVERVCRNLLFMRISRLEEEELNKFKNNIKNYHDHFFRATAMGAFAASIPAFLGIVLLAIILNFSRNYFGTNPTYILGFLYLFVRFVQQVSNLSTQFGTLSSHHSSFLLGIEIVNSLDEKTFNEVVEQTNDIGKISSIIEKENSNLDNQNESKPVMSLNRSNSPPPDIELKNIEFKWEERARKIFDDFSLRIMKGETLGIVGPSGCGKSSLLSIVLGIVEPAKGSVLLSGVEPNRYLEMHSDSIGYVGAEPFLIEGSIKSNLLYGNKFSISSKQIWQALKMAMVDDVVKSLPSGLDHCLNSNGEGLSAGQKQRISLARALLKQPSLLILDEASSNLDVDTEKSIMKTINLLKNKCTIIIVSHRQGMLNGLDSLVRLEAN